MKLCGTCKALKVAGDFNRKTRSPDGLQPSCRACSKETSAAHYAAHPEKYLAARWQFTLSYWNRVAPQLKKVAA